MLLAWFSFRMYVFKEGYCREKASRKKRGGGAKKGLKATTIRAE